MTRYHDGRLSLELPSVAQLSADVDVDVLENTPLTLSTRQLRKGGKGDADKTGTTTSPEEMKKKKKRKRKRECSLFPGCVCVCMCVFVPL